MHQNLPRRIKNGLLENLVGGMCLHRVRLVEDKAIAASDSNVLVSMLPKTAGLRASKSSHGKSNCKCCSTDYRAKQMLHRLTELQIMKYGGNQEEVEMDMKGRCCPNSGAVPIAWPPILVTGPAHV